MGQLPMFREEEDIIRVAVRMLLYFGFKFFHFPEIVYLLGAHCRKHKKKASS